MASMTPASARQSGELEQAGDFREQALPVRQVMPDASQAREMCPADVHDTSVKRHWLTLIAFCLNTALNSFCSVNFSVVEHMTRQTLHIHDQNAVAWFYTGFLLTVCAGMIPGMLMVVHYEGVALGFSIVMNVGCTWLRWLGMSRHDYTLCLASVIMGGAGAWPILTLPAQLSQRFPPHMWAFTTSLAVQANYTGWLLGSVIPPAVVTDPESMTRFMFWQAVASLLVIVAFAAFYSPQAREERLVREEERLDLSSTVLAEQGEVLSQRDVGNRSHGAHGGGGDDGGIYQLLRCFWRYPSFGLQVLAYGMLGGVSFAFPGCDDALLGPHGYSPRLVSVVNLAFLATGIVCGVSMGKNVSNPRHYGKVLKGLFVSCTFSLSIIAVFFETGIAPDRPSTSHIVIVALLFSVVGMASLGFIGLGIEAAALYPTGSAYVCFSIESLVQIFGALLNQISLNGRGFAIIAGTAWLATLLLLLGYHQHRGAEENSSSLRQDDVEASSVESARTALVPRLGTPAESTSDGAK